MNLGSDLAVVLYRYVDVPAFGPFPVEERSMNERVVHELNVKSLNDLAGSVNTRILPSSRRSP